MHKRTLHNSVLIASAAMALALASSAQAKDTFNSSGTITVTWPGGTLACNAAQSGTLKPFRITSSVHSGAAGCSSLMSLGLPWSIHRTGPTKAMIRNVGLLLPDASQCGLNKLKTVITGTTMTFTGRLRASGQICEVSGSSTVTGGARLPAD